MARGKRLFCDQSHPTGAEWGEPVPAPGGSWILRENPSKTSRQKVNAQQGKLQSSLLLGCPGQVTVTIPVTYSARFSGSCSGPGPSSKARSVKSREWYSPRSTGHERRAPLRTRHSRMLSRPHDTSLSQETQPEHQGRALLSPEGRAVSQGPLTARTENRNGNQIAAAQFPPSCARVNG